ncbi:MAG: flagellar basal body P-ring protein FlgI [Planctomycetota bacterium]
MSDRAGNFQAAGRLTQQHGGRLSDHPRTVRLAAWLCLLLSAGLCGCTTGLLNLPKSGMFADRSGEPKDADAKSKSKSKSKSEAKSNRRKKEEDNDFGTRIETPLLSEYMSVQGNSLVVLRGVGLVMGLEGNGGDPSPSTLRTQLQNEMARRGVKDANRILSSRNTALVVVTAYLPAMVRKNQRFDVRVAIPPNSNARSLKGGWLLETRLFEEQNIQGRTALKAQEYAVAGGAILTGLGSGKPGDERQAELMAGTIPGGAISKVDRDLTIQLRSDKRGTRNSERVATAVSNRFDRYNKYGQRIKCAEAKDDVRINLKIHSQYVNNFPRYQAVIRNIALNETDVARRMRMEMLAREVLEPETCQLSALQLEAIGEDSIPFLKEALTSESFEVRFYAAQSLAYLGDSSGVSVLRDAALKETAFRVYSLVALSVIRDDADAVLALRELMNAPSLETRYGALRALKELEPQDPSLNAVSFRDRFVMNVIDASGEPMVHVTRRRIPEIVVFGAEQGFQLPAVLNAGNRLSIRGAAGSDSVEIVRYELNREPTRQRVRNRLPDIIRTCGEMGANYPDLVQMLVEAEQQRNFMGTFGIDRLPQAGRVYLREGDDPQTADAEADADASASSSKSGSKSAKKSNSKSDSKSAESQRRIGNSRMLPELFDELDESELEQNETAEKLLELDFREVNERDNERAGLVGRVLDDEGSDEQGSSDQPAPAAEKDSQGTARPGKPSSKRDAVNKAGAKDADDEQTDADADMAEGVNEPEEAGPPDTGRNRTADAADQPDAGEDTMEEPEAEAAAKPAGRGGFLSRLRRPFRDLEEPE